MKLKTLSLAASAILAAGAVTNAASAQLSGEPVSAAQMSPPFNP